MGDAACVHGGRDLRGGRVGHGAGGWFPAAGRDPLLMVVGDGRLDHARIVNCANVEMSEMLCGVCNSIDLSGRSFGLLGGWFVFNRA